MFSKMPKPVYRVLLGLFIFSLVAVACNNKKKEEKPADPAVQEQPKMDPAPTNDTLNTGDTGKPVVPDNKTIPPPPPGN